jgi:hypothetical protein
MGRNLEVFGCSAKGTKIDQNEWPFSNGGLIKYRF